MGVTYLGGRWAPSAAHSGARLAPPNNEAQRRVLLFTQFHFTHMKLVDATSYPQRVQVAPYKTNIQILLNTCVRITLLHRSKVATSSLGKKEGGGSCYWTSHSIPCMTLFFIIFRSSRYHETSKSTYKKDSTIVHSSNVHTYNVCHTISVCCEEESQKQV